MTPVVGKEYFDLVSNRKITIIEYIGCNIYSVYDESDDEYYELDEMNIGFAVEPKQNPFGEYPEPTPEPLVGYQTPNPFRTNATLTPTTRVPQKDLFSYSKPSQAPVLKETKNNNKEEGRFNMNIKRLFGEFGRVNNGEVVLTFDGKVAVKRNDEEYVRYDAEKEQIVNHLGMVLDSVSKFFYVLPVTKVEEGDVIKFKGIFYQVLGVTEKGVIKAVNLKAGTTSTICKETNAFGINLYYKVTSLLDTNGEAKQGLNPMMLMMLDKDSDKFEDILPLMMLTGQGFDGAEGFNNPLLLMTLLDKDGKGGKDSSMKDIMMMQMLSGQGTGAAAGANMFSNPLMLMTLLDKDGGMDMKDIMMMQAFSGQAGTDGANPFSNPMMLMMLLDK
jgi:hypothetical protein